MAMKTNVSGKICGTLRSSICNIEDKNTYENIFSQASNMFELIDLAIEQKSYVAAEEVSPNYLSGEDHWKKEN